MSILWLPVSCPHRISHGISRPCLIYYGSCMGSFFIILVLASTLQHYGSWFRGRWRSNWKNCSAQMSQKELEQCSISSLGQMKTFEMNVTSHFLYFDDVIKTIHIQHSPQTGGTSSHASACQSTSSHWGHLSCSLSWCLSGARVRAFRLSSFCLPSSSQQAIRGIVNTHESSTAWLRAVSIGGGFWVFLHSQVQTCSCLPSF